MRTITLIVIHCSAVRPDQESSAKDIDNWHRDKGWNGIGYHYVVRRSGQIEPGRPEETVGAHCVNHNRHSLGICYEGGLDIRGKPADTRTEAQRASLRRLLEELHRAYPRALIVGHHDLNPQKDCPCYRPVTEYADLQPK
ncbi:MAG: N-acetylmuramoyl-L-alanine amidase [Prevotella sp.]|nr:N-acetylmuramoyl-L-alanine amidase [Prevotella sp.]